MYLRLVVTFFLKLLRLHVIEHVSLGFNVNNLVFNICLMTLVAQPVFIS